MPSAYPPMDMEAIDRLIVADAVCGNFGCPWGCDGTDNAWQGEAFRPSGDHVHYQLCPRCGRRWTEWRTWCPNPVGSALVDIQPGWPLHMVPAFGQWAVELN